MRSFLRIIHLPPQNFVHHVIITGFRKLSKYEVGLDYNDKGHTSLMKNRKMVKILKDDTSRHSVSSVVSCRLNKKHP